MANKNKKRAKKHKAPQSQSQSQSPASSSASSRAHSATPTATTTATPETTAPVTTTTTTTAALPTVAEELSPRRTGTETEKSETKASGSSGIAIAMSPNAAAETKQTSQPGTTRLGTSYSSARPIPTSTASNKSFDNDDDVQVSASYKAKKATYGALLNASRDYNTILGSSPNLQNGTGSGSAGGTDTNAATNNIQIPTTLTAGSSPRSFIQAGTSAPRQIPFGTPRQGADYDFPRGRKSISSSFHNAAQSFSPNRFISSRPDSPSAQQPISDHEVVKALNDHLVTREDILENTLNYMDEGTSSGAPPITTFAKRGSTAGVSDSTFGSVSHNLLGGADTRDIYQWKEKRESIDHRRRNSESDLLEVSRRQTPDIVHASDLREPGGFRRHFLRNKAKNEGREANLLTRNFIDFLALYGTYGGDVVPSDDEGDNDFSDDDDMSDFMAHANHTIYRASGAGGSGAGGNGGGSSESDPLLDTEHGHPQRMRVMSATPVHGTSAKKAFFLVMKAFVGTGVLFLPKAFANGGMGFSIILLILMGWLTLHCMILLVETSRTLGGSFGDIGEKLYGPWMRTNILASIAISQAGFCCAYYIFVAQNLRDIVMMYSDCRWVYPEWFYLIIQAIIYIPLAWVRRIKHFSITSLIADVFIIMGLAYIFYFDLTVLAKQGPAPNLVMFNLESFPLFVGTAMFAFEGICLILPISESMKRPERFSWVLTLCISVIGVLFIVIGATGYLTFGEKVETIVFLNLPKGSKFVTSLQFFYALAIMLSFPLTVYPSIKIFEGALFGQKDGKSSNLVKWQKNLFRAALVAFLAYIAYAGSSNLDKFVSLVGCLACIPLSFIYPALFHYHISSNIWVKMKDIMLVILGTIALFYTTYVTIQQWIAGSPDIPVDRCQSLMLQ